jgi:hypothetical protein
MLNTTIISNMIVEELIEEEMLQSFKELLNIE